MWNHDFFWRSLTPSGAPPKGRLKDAIQRDFGGVEALTKQLAEAGKTKFGSGWAWLCSRAGKRAVEDCTIIAKHIRAELAEAGLPVLHSEMMNRVAYPEAALWGATPSLISWKGPAAREIATIADELDGVLGAQQAAA